MQQSVLVDLMAEQKVSVLEDFERTDLESFISDNFLSFFRLSFMALFLSEIRIFFSAL